MVSFPRIAFQLYSVRSHPDSLPNLIRRIADSGYDGVEFAHRFQEEPPDEIAAALEETGVVPVAVHADISTIEEALRGETDLLERCAAIGCDRLIVAHPAKTHFHTRESVRSLADRLNRVARALEERGLELGLHNDRRWLCPLLPNSVEMVVDEMPLPDGTADFLQGIGRRFQARSTGSVPRQTPLWHLIEGTDSEAIWFELEVAELHAGGIAPTAAFMLLDDRVEMLHLRDVVPGTGLGEYDNAPLGKGVIDTTQILQDARDTVTWIVYENELDIPPEEKIEAGRRFFERVDTDQAAMTGSELSLD